MPRTARLTLALAIAVSLLAVACGSSDDPELTDIPPVPSPTPTAPADGGEGEGDAPEEQPTPEPDATPTPAPTATPEVDPDGGQTDLPDTGGQPVLAAIFTTGGFVPVEVALGDFPELVIMADGTVYREGAQIAVFPPPLLPAVERLTLDDAALTEVKRVLAESTVLDPAVDFGEPPVADAPATTVTTFLGGDETTVSAYALGFDDQVGPDAAAARAELTAIITEIQTIVDRATATGTLARPPAAAVLTFPSLATEEDQPVREWPIEPVPRPQATGGGCVVITGADMDALWDAAGNATIQTPWNIEGTPQPVVLRPVFPHETVC